jgi:hypothetical protein
VLTQQSLHAVLVKRDVSLAYRLSFGSVLFGPEDLPTQLRQTYGGDEAYPTEAEDRYR